MKPSEPEIEQTILSIQMRLIEPIMQDTTSTEFREGYQTALYILKHRIVDMEQINHLKFDSQIPMQIAQMAILYQMGSWSKFDLLYMPVQRLPSPQQEKALAHGIRLYNEIHNRSAEELEKEGLTSFVDLLQKIRKQYGLIETCLFVAGYMRRIKKPVIHVDIPLQQIN